MASFSDQPVVATRSRHWTTRDLASRVPVTYAIGLAAGVPLAALAFAYLGAGAQAAVAAFVVAVLTVLCAVDIAERRLPNRIVLPATAGVLAVQTALFPDRTLEWIAAATAAPLVLLLAVLVYPEGLGMGDVKLAALLGAALGGAVVTALLLGFVAAALYALVLLARHGTAARRRTIPLGPFLAFGAVIPLLLL